MRGCREHIGFYRGWEKMGGSIGFMWGYGEEIDNHRLGLRICKA